MFTCLELEGVAHQQKKKENKLILRGSHYFAMKNYGKFTNNYYQRKLGFGTRL